MTAPIQQSFLTSMAPNQPVSGHCVQSYDGRSIPQEDLDHAWELASKYPPDIVLFIIREAVKQHSNTIPKMDQGMASPVSGAISPNFQSTTSRNLAVNEDLTSIDTSLGILHGDRFDTSLLSSSGSKSGPASSNNIYGGTDGTGSFSLSEGEISGVDHQYRSVEVSPDQVRSVARSTKNSVPNSDGSLDKLSDSKAEKRKLYFCVFEEHRTVRFGKAADLRKHFNLYHEPGKKAWVCSEGGCGQLFSRAESFKQHHRRHNGCRKPCQHADRNKIKIPSRQSFACGCQSCQALFFKWEEWREHVIQHIEAGMSDSQWHYATIFLNLLRRPEIAPQWQSQLSRAHSFDNLVPRFNFRPRKTFTLKWDLEHMNPTELHRAASKLASQAYEAGIEIRNLQELSDPFSLVEQPKTSTSSTISHSTPLPALSEGLFPLSNTDLEGQFPILEQQYQPDPQQLSSNPGPFTSYNGERVNSNKGVFINQYMPFYSFGMADLGSDIEPPDPFGVL
jgi:hypothetical protein